MFMGSNNNPQITVTEDNMSASLQVAASLIVIQQ